MSCTNKIILKNPGEKIPGIGMFQFSDRYKIYDWSEMPDNIINKGAASCLASAYFFEELNDEIPNHYIGLVSQTSDKTADKMLVNLVNEIRPTLVQNEERIGYDFNSYSDPELSNIVIPVEFFYRNSLPEGSSMFRRLSKGEVHYTDLGLKDYPSGGCKLPEPIIDFSLRLESERFYPVWKVRWEWLKVFSGMTDNEIEKTKEYIMKINSMITRKVSEYGLSNDDGKIEFGFDQDRKIMVVDFIGNLDECRYTFNNIPVGKEMLRQWYRRNQHEWVSEIMNKKSANPNWREKVKEKPKNIPNDMINVISNVYASFTNSLLGRDVFDVQKLDEAILSYAKIMERDNAKK